MRNWESGQTLLNEDATEITAHRRWRSPERKSENYH
jgi:hypothetical protein